MAVDPGLSPVAIASHPIWQLIDSSTVGGIESHIATLSEALIATGERCEIVLLEDHGANAWLGQLATRQLPVRSLGGGFTSLLQAMRAEKPAILHTHGYKAGIFGRLAAVLTGIPSVSTFHAGERGAFPVSLYQTIDRLTSVLATRIAVSEQIAAGLPFAAEVIRNFVTIPAAPPRPGPRKRVAFVGRLSAEKGPDLFCRIAALCHSSIRFDVYGDGPMRADLERRFAPRVRFNGLQTDMGKVWPDIGLLLMPSRAEGLPMAALEAMARGVPVAAARVGALPEAIGSKDTGWLFDAGDVEGAAEAVIDWSTFDDGALRRLASACRARIVARYGPDAPVERLRQIYAALRRH